MRAIDRGELSNARALLDAMGTDLRARWQGEEEELFAVLGRDELFAEHIGPLVREHRALDELLGTVDLSEPGEQERVGSAVLELHQHIAKEEDVIFPASLTALGGDEWDASIQAWHAAHPDSAMIGE